LAGFSTRGVPVRAIFRALALVLAEAAVALAEVAVGAALVADPAGTAVWAPRVTVVARRMRGRGRMKLKSKK